MPDASCYTTSEHDGLLEMCKDLGDRVEAGDVLARVHDAMRTGRRPAEYRAKRSGLLAARHFPGLVQIGDTVAVVADIVERGIPAAGAPVAGIPAAGAPVAGIPAAGVPAAGARLSG
jgi:N-alpha-acetyl-L-2,4-diaminobutyrate deacetylase